MTLNHGLLEIGGMAGFGNPLDSPYPRKQYAEGKESARISFKSIWIDRYIRGEDGHMKEFQSCQLKLLSNGKAYLDGKELKDEKDRKSASEIFTNLKLSD